MLNGLSEKSLATIFVLLLIAAMYFLGKLYSYIDDERFNSYRFLGPLAFMIPGTLKPKGWIYLCSFFCATAALFVLSIYMFEFGELLSSDIQ